MNRFLIIILMIIISVTANPQNIQVLSFRLLETDLTANMYDTKEKDHNGETAALIKVVTTNTGFSFYTDNYGIIKTHQTPAEIWVYVQHGVKMITISHPELGMLKSYYFPIPIEAARTYEMVLHSNTLQSFIEKGDNSSKPLYGGLRIDSNPVGATIKIDGNLIGKTPQIIENIPVGKHIITLEKDNYTTVDDSVIVELGKISDFSFTLKGGDDLIFKVGDVTFKMIRVEGGVFNMGATKEQERPNSDETPAHLVTLSSYYIGESEVMQALWQEIMGENPSENQESNYPVENVTWKDCQLFIKRLNKITDANFRLPTEAEWEFAARGGNNSHGYQYSGSNNIEDVAWYNGNSEKRTHEVKTKMPNELNLYDMSGNVSEWCDDWSEGRNSFYEASPQTNPKSPQSSKKKWNVARGGSFSNNQWANQVAKRNHENKNYKYIDIGFRLAL